MFRLPENRCTNQKTNRSLDLFLIMHSNKLFCRDCYGRIELSESLYHFNRCKTHYGEYIKTKEGKAKLKAKAS